MEDQGVALSSSTPRGSDHSKTINDDGHKSPAPATSPRSPSSKERNSQEVTNTSVANPRSPRKDREVQENNNQQRRNASGRQRILDIGSADNSLENCHWTRGQRPMTTSSNPNNGFDNSDRNKNRRILGSSTDHVAENRLFFGPWFKTDSARQRTLVERLAPYKPPAPPDPRFDSWVNHFEYYWNIGVDIKPKKTPKRPSGDSFNGCGFFGYDGNNRLYKSQYHRVLKRPRTTHGRLLSGSSGSEGEHNMSSSSSSGHGGGGTTGSDGYDVLPSTTSRFFVGSCREHHVWGRGSQSARPGYHGGRESEMDSSRSTGNKGVVSGLKRRYMGLQSVSSDQMEAIVNRLTRLTPAYYAKFAPNPHVWVDNSPGAHMIIKRENTVA